MDQDERQYAQSRAPLHVFPPTPSVPSYCLYGQFIKTELLYESLELSTKWWKTKRQGKDLLFCSDERSMTSICTTHFVNCKHQFGLSPAALKETHLTTVEEAHQRPFILVDYSVYWTSRESYSLILFLWHGSLCPKYYVKTTGITNCSLYNLNKFEKKYWFSYDKFVLLNKWNTNRLTPKIYVWKQHSFFHLFPCG